MKIHPLLLAITAMIYTVDVFASRTKNAEITLVCFLSAVVTMAERTQFGVVFAHRCRKQKYKSFNQFGKTGNIIQY